MKLIKSIRIAAERIAIQLHDTSFYNILRSYGYEDNGKVEYRHGKDFNAFKYLTFYASSKEKRFAIILIDNKGNLNFIFESKQPKRVADWLVKNKHIALCKLYD